MKKTVYIGEDKLMKIKNAMADDNISRSTFMHEDTPPYEEDEFEIGGEGSNNDFFHINEISQDDLDFILKFKPNDYVRWVVFVKNGMIPKYFEKKSYAVDWLKWCKHWFNQGEIIDLNKYQNINESDDNKKNVLNEYSSELRLPFDEPEYANKFYIEQYKDWLEDFGRYGELPSGNLNFWDEIKKAVMLIKEKCLKGRFDSSFPSGSTVEEILEDLKNDCIGPYIKITNDGKVYVERAISINEKSRYYDYDKVNAFYDRLKHSYNDNVGGCWSYLENGSRAYCGEHYGEVIILRGFIRTDDIDFVKTVQLNYHYSDEHEIRVKPFAKVELFNFSYGGDTINFDRKLIVSSTYAGNNSKFMGNIGKIDDGFGNITYINRNNEKLDDEGYYREVSNYIKSVNPFTDLKRDGIYADRYGDSGLIKITLSNGKVNLLDSTTNNFLFDTWYDGIFGEFAGEFDVVKLNNKYNYINKEGKLLWNKPVEEWFDNCSLRIEHGCGRVGIYHGKIKYNLISTEGKLMWNKPIEEWFDECGQFTGDFAEVAINKKSNYIDKNGNILWNKPLNEWFDFVSGYFYFGMSIVGIGNKYNFINSGGDLIYKKPVDEWFDELEDFNNGVARVKLNDKYNFINSSGDLIYKKPLNEWFDGANKWFKGEFIPVNIGKKYNHIDKNGNLLCDRPIEEWFDWCRDFRGNFAVVGVNGKYNYIDKNGNILWNKPLNEWFDLCEDFYDGFSNVGNYVKNSVSGKKYNILSDKGNLLWNKPVEEWFDKVANFFQYGFITVSLFYKNGYKYNFIGKNGNLLWNKPVDEWFDDAYYGFREDGYSEVGFDNDKREYKIDTNGNLTVIESNTKGKRLIVNEDQLLVLKESTFEDWFGNSILKDEQGNPIKMYHGTDAEFNSFSKDFIGSTGSYEGYGFNFTPYESRARGYNSKNVIEAYLKVENPMTTKSNNISLNDLIKIIAELDEGKEYTDTIVAAYEPAGYGEKWDAAYYRRALPVAAKTIYQYNIESEYGDAGIYAEICINGNADKFKTIDVFEKLGYDSAIFYDNDGRINTVVVFEPNQIKRTSNKTFDLNSDIMDESFRNKNIIKESQESKSISAAKKLVMQRLGYNEQEADEFIRIKLRNDIPTLRTPQGGKFILGATRMFCDGELRSANDIGNLNSTLKLVASDAHINEYDRNLNNLSCQELIQRFAKAMSDNIEAEKDEVNQMVFDSPSDYEIVRIDSFGQAKEYGDYVSWCVTHDEEMFNSYAGNGINQFYFCLKNGFENVEEVPSEGCPLDEYGLSMIAVSVNENGMLNTCTCRWNHDNGGDDSVMNTKEISQVIGMNFFEVFKPNNKWKDVLSRLMQRLENGDNPNNVFNFVGRFSEGFAPVEISGKRNFINQEGKLLSDQWFDSAGMFSEGFATIKLNNKWNFINKEGKLLSDKWFEEVGVFSEGFATIRLNNKENFINQEGKLLSDRWFDYANGFSEGFSSIGLDNKENFINQEGKLLSDQWFDDAGSFREGLAVVRIGYKQNFINQEGNLISDKWFNYANDFKEGFAVVILNKKYNFINQEGKLLSNKWFDDAADFSEGLANITLNKKHNFINQEGKLLSNQWFSYTRNFSEGFAVVRLNKKDNFINQEGKLLSNQWFDSASNFNEGLAKIILNNKCNFINQECKILCNQWFDDAYDFFRGFAVVILNKKCNFISKEGNILSSQWFDSATYFDSNGFADVAINGNRYKIDTNGNLVLKESKNKRKNILVSESQLITLKENMETEVEASEVNLDSFKKNSELAPKMWDGFDLDPRARLKLLDIADDFWDFANISWVKPKGIHLTGSICNFNWSKYSDIDLHIVVDFSEIDERKDFVQEYFDAKKNEWNDEHSNLKIYDYPVELYVEDINAETESGGLYDLEENDWIKKPDKDNVKQIGLDKYEIKNEAAKLMTSIDDLCDEFDATDDDAKLREIGEKSHGLLKKIKNMRKLGLKRGGESDSFNIIYKVLRRAGYMDMLWDLSSSLYDKLNSIGINESISNDNEIFDLAKERFGVTHDIRECGYILPDGSMLDFSGRHMITGNTDASHLKGRRSVDHREIGDINWDDDMNTKTNANINMPEFIRKGAIRIHCSNSWSSINLFTKPTKEQINPLLRLIQYSKGNVTVEIGDGDNSYEYAEWDDANPRRVINDVIRYFDGETVNLVGNVVENKIISAYYNKFIGINEEVVADGNADHNPFKQRWKRERDILKNYLCNYGEIMTSKENGKQYKVLYDTTLSSRLGINYCICIQWNPITMEPGNVIYVRAFDKFTRRIFRPQFDTRGFDNIAGTYDDVV